MSRCTVIVWRVVQFHFKRIIFADTRAKSVFLNEIWFQLRMLTCWLVLSKLFCNLFASNKLAVKSKWKREDEIDGHKLRYIEILCRKKITFKMFSQKAVYYLCSVNPLKVAFAVFAFWLICFRTRLKSFTSYNTVAFEFIFRNSNQNDWRAIHEVIQLTTFIFPELEDLGFASSSNLSIKLRSLFW